MKHTQTGETGDIFESRLYPDGDKRLHDLHTIHYKEIPYDSFRHAMQLVLDGEGPGAYSPEEASNPPSRWVNDIHALIATELNLEDWTNLRIHPCPKTSADVHHGYDFVVEYIDPQTKKQYVITIDMTLQTKKDDHKADVIVKDNGAIPHPRFGLDEIILPDIEQATREEDAAQQAKTKYAIATVIHEVLTEKMKNQDTFSAPQKKKIHTKHRRLGRYWKT